MLRRRRTDQLGPAPARTLLMDDPRSFDELERRITDAGFASASIDTIPDGPLPPLDPLIARALQTSSLAEHVSDSGVRRAAFPVAHHGPERGTSIALVVDPHLTRRDSEALALWAAPREQAPIAAPRSVALAYELNHALDGDAFVSALFARAGMLVELHTRSGALLRSWRVPVESVWAEAARHGAAYLLGELARHSGTEALASLGLDYAAIVGLDNGNGLAIGAVGVAAAAPLRGDATDVLLERAPTLGPHIMSIRSTTRVPQHAHDGTVDLDVLAARIACQRCATWSVIQGKLRPIAAHDSRGERQSLEHDDVERDLVEHAMKHGKPTSVGPAAAVPIGSGAVLYAFDPLRNPMERIKLALHDLRHDPFGRGDNLAA